MVHCLAEPEGVQLTDDISVAMVTSGLEDVTTHFLPRHKAWARDGRVWCMLRQGR